jgi:hypothetical protein
VDETARAGAVRLKPNNERNCRQWQTEGRKKKHTHPAAQKKLCAPEVLRFDLFLIWRIP